MDKAKKLTPAMQQFFDIKEQYSDCVIFFRMGDFYETFGEDAVITAKVTGMTLTKRSKGEDALPLCGAPYHSVDKYLRMMVEAGHKVVIVEQLEDPKEVKGVVKRGVVKVVTSGTLEQGSVGGLNENRYILSMAMGPLEGVGIAICDVHIGEFKVCEVMDLKLAINEVYKLQPQELVINIDDKEILSQLESLGIKNITKVKTNQKEELILNHFKIKSLASFGIEKMNLGIVAAANLLDYIRYTQKDDVAHIDKIVPYSVEGRMILDESTIRSLDILYSSDFNTSDSLLSVIDSTLTAMGKRRLRYEIVRPLLDQQEIEKRHNLVEVLFNDNELRKEIRELLSSMYDVDRILAKIARGTANPGDLLALAQTYDSYVQIQNKKIF